MPEGLLFQINPDQVRPVLEAILPDTPLFGMTFRYNAARALMMGCLLYTSSLLTGINEDATLNELLSYLK